MLAEPDLPWPRCYRAMELRLTYRRHRSTGWESDGPRHQWAMILDCDLSELDGGTPMKSPRPPFRILANYGELTEEDRERGLELLSELRPRPRRPIDMFGAADRGEPPADGE